MGMKEMDQSLVGMDQVVGLDGIDWNEPIKFLYGLGLIDRGVQRELQKKLGSFGLSVNEYTTLHVLEQSPGLSSAELARRALVTPQSMNELVARLEERGLLERETNPSHARILLAKVTAAGAKLAGEATPAVEAVEAELLGLLPDEDLEVVRRSLLVLLRRLRGIDGSS